MHHFSLQIFALAFSVILLPAGEEILAAVKVGDQAPEIGLVDTDGKTQTLSQYSGKLVVLEWHNEGCPYVKKHYDADPSNPDKESNMHALQKKYTGKGVAWITIISSVAGKQGYMTLDEGKAYRKKLASSALILDSESKVARAYGAQTTPHMFVIGKDGKVIYRGAIDDRPTTDKADNKIAKNYVAAAVDAALANKPVALSETKAYGCSVKY